MLCRSSLDDPCPALAQILSPLKEKTDEKKIIFSQPPLSGLCYLITLVCKYKST